MLNELHIPANGDTEAVMELNRSMPADTPHGEVTNVAVGVNILIRFMLGYGPNGEDDKVDPDTMKELSKQLDVGVPLDFDMCAQNICKGMTEWLLTRGRVIFVDDGQPGGISMIKAESVQDVVPECN